MQPIEEIRTVLLKEINLFRKKGGDTERAKIISEMSAQTIYSIRVELENKRLELEIGKSDDQVKAWMNKDFSDITTMRD
jgi:hypothetical protein